MAILHLKNHHRRKLISNVLCFKNKREPLILLTILLGLLTELVVFSIDYSFQTHYTVGFFRSFVIFSTCLLTMSLTVSIRIFTLMLLLITSMSFDAFILIEPDLFWVTKDARGVFSSVYRVFEILAITYSGLSYLVACNTHRLLSQSCKRYKKNTPA